MEKDNKVRMQIHVVPDVKQYLDEQSQAYGMSISAYLTMIIQQHRLQNNVLGTMSEMIKRLDNIEKAALEK